MERWQDIKSAPLNQLVLTTDGTDVYEGQVDCDLIFRGENLADGEYAAFNLGSLTGWQPAPATFQPEKSADEMFRELGYLWESTPIEGGRGYEDEDSNKIEVDGYRVTFTPEGGGMALTVGAKTILACAQLIREMEASADA